MDAAEKIKRLKEIRELLDEADTLWRDLYNREAFPDLDSMIKNTEEALVDALLKIHRGRIKKFFSVPPYVRQALLNQGLIDVRVTPRHGELYITPSGLKRLAELEKPA